MGWIGAGAERACAGVCPPSSPLCRPRPAQWGGAVYMYSSSTATFEGCTFTSNTANVSARPRL